MVYMVSICRQGARDSNGDTVSREWRGTAAQHTVGTWNLGVLDAILSCQPSVSNPNYATATKKFVSPSFLFTSARLAKSSPTANLNLSAVAGLSNLHFPAPLLPPIPAPFIVLAALTASLNAKNTVLPKNNGGSPIPLLLCTLLR